MIGLKYRDYMKIKFAAILSLLVICSLCACGLPVKRSAIIGDMIYPAQVPASFEVMIVCKTSENQNDLTCNWSCDNGTIKGTGNTVIWAAPGVTGRYDIGVRLIDKSGNEEKRTINIEVVNFGRTEVDTSTDIALKFPLFGSNSVSEQYCISPATTLEISAADPWKNFSKYTYRWSHDGGKMSGPGIKDGTADKIGWTSPGVGGNYTVKLLKTGEYGDIAIGHVFVYVKNPGCCNSSGPCRITR